MARRKVCPENRVVMHCHPLHTMGLTFVLPEDEAVMTRVTKLKRDWQLTIFLILNVIQDNKPFLRVLFFAIDLWNKISNIYVKNKGVYDEII